MPGKRGEQTAVQSARRTASREEAGLGYACRRPESGPWEDGGAEDVLLLGSVWSEGPGEGSSRRACPRGDCAGLSSWAVGWSPGHLPGRVGSSWGIGGVPGPSWGG